MGDVVIRLNGQVVERTIYWIIIVVLATLLVLSFFKSDCSAGDEEVKANQDEIVLDDDDNIGTGGTTVIEDPIPPPDDPPAVDETCDDNIKNQDESGVDCGGDCDGCELGDSCDINSDCADGECIDDECTEPAPDLSGEVTLAIDKVEELKSPTSGFYKVDAIELTITNGKGSTLDAPYANIFVKSTGGVYLNQFGDTSVEYSPYFTFDGFGDIDSAESMTKLIDIGGSYIFSQAGYAEGDDFKVTVEIFDEDDNRLDSESYTVKL